MVFLSEVNMLVVEFVELFFFSDLFNQVVVQKIYFFEICFILLFEGDIVFLEFVVLGGGNEYFDLRWSCLYVKVKII